MEIHCRDDSVKAANAAPERTNPRKPTSPGTGEVDGLSRPERARCGGTGRIFATDGSEPNSSIRAP
jgi:hypothetical protein